MLFFLIEIIKEFNDNRKKGNCLLPNPTLHLKPKADDKRIAECEKY